ncbi:MAG: hypothetical protein VB096_03055 [Pseudoflavonifractor sp.]|nr:hypothetical protein [Pseudoflavonifractor sp.]
MKPIKARNYGFILLGVVLLSAIAGIFLAGPLRNIAICISAITIVAYVLLILMYWRCPNCGELLPTTGMWGIRICPYCGQRLNENTKQENSSSAPPNDTSDVPPPSP